MTENTLTAAEVLERAADIVSAGWVRGAFGIEDCYCVRGAISKAADRQYLSRGHDEAELLLARSIGLRHANSAQAGALLVKWNDDPKRTQAEVATALREAAALARSEQPQ